ncbi:DUF305 domain-containing protein [Maricaulis parjimensis]|uniref:DUF305 domain-containing protein n=1 Tax=Maricaulis parjimensis TaxID=144023 RepID=UPI001939FD55|nr:DUF305 domain-containing protein [Maricaulis parjimensis]
MLRRTLLSVVPLFALTAGTVLAQPPIVQPGAPGQPSRTLTPEASTALAASHHTADDAAFMQHMIVHHGQAVDMVALIAERTDNRTIALVGDRISRSQSDEIAMMRRWLESRGESTEMVMDHTMMPGHNVHTQMAHAQAGGHGHPANAPSDVPLMEGMLSPAQMVELSMAEGEAFDRLFLTGMIHHHQGAIGMVEDLLATPGNGEDPELSQFLTDVMADQSSEIARMRSILAGL